MARNQGHNSDRDQANAKALAVYQPPRLPMPKEAAGIGVLPGQWKTIVESVFPSAKSVDGVMMALNYCRARNLDVFKRVVHVVPMYSSQLGREVETVWPGIGEMRTTASRTSSYAGIDECVFGPTKKMAFSESVQKKKRNDEPYTVSASCPEFRFPEWAQVTVYKMVQGQRVAFVGPKVRFLEIFSGVKGLRVPNDRWRSAPWQMIEKCAEAAGLRRAFPEELGDQWSSDEMEGKVYKGEVIEGDFNPLSAEQIERTRAEHPEDDAADYTAVYEREQDLGGWDPEELAAEVEYFRDALDTVNTLAKLERGLNGYRARIEALPDAELDKVNRWAAEARRRLEPAPDEQHGSVLDKGQHEADTGSQEPEDTWTDTSPRDQEPAFLRNFRTRLAEIDTMVDVNSFESSERRSIEQQTPAVAQVCKALIDQLRAVIRARPADED